MLDTLSSSEVIKLRHALQRGTAYVNSTLANQANTIVVGLAAETAARIAADNAEAATRAASDAALQAQITELQKPRFDHSLLLGGM